ncbi:MAG: diguanylate cyclase [Ilumatobacteraceae bacterium]|nr:diguanylate cyclase [Ilumatobacteraceae bacterium]
MSDTAGLIASGADARLIHLAEILEESLDYVATTDLYGQILYANRAFRDRFGLRTIDGIASESYSLFSFFTERSREHFLAEAVPELWRGGRWTGEVEANNADGPPIILSQSAIAHLGPDGRPMFFSGIARDISSVKAAEAEARDADERFRALVAQGSDVILVLDAVGSITYASPAMARIMDYPDGSLIGTPAFELIHPDDLDGVLSRFVAIMGDADSVGHQYRVRHHDGSWRWVESFTSNHLDTPGVNGLIVNARDITARHQANEELANAAALLSSVMRAAASEAIFVTDREARIVAFSRGAEVLLGYDADEVVGVLHPRVFHLEDEIAALAGEIGITPDELFHHEPPEGKSIAREWAFVRKDGSTFDGSLIVSTRYDEAGEVAGFLYLAADITERRQREAVLTQQAEHDTLTGLANRQCLQRALGVAIGDETWHAPGRILLFIDLDRFKHVNDTYGHAVGDAVLVGVAQRLKDNLRAGDLAVRLGGDEFVILLDSQVTADLGLSIAQRIVAAIGRPFEVDQHEISIGASVGLSVSRVGWTAEELVLAADGAAYAAKHNGRGRVATASAA